MATCAPELMQKIIGSFLAGGGMSKSGAAGLLERRNFISDVLLKSSLLVPAISEPSHSTFTLKYKSVSDRPQLQIMSSWTTVTGTVWSVEDKTCVGPLAARTTGT